MGRPKQYTTAADRQAAYRRRLQDTAAVVDRQALEHLHQRLEQLQHALVAARAHGDPLAQAACSASIETMLDKLHRPVSYPRGGLDDGRAHAYDTQMTQRPSGGRHGLKQLDAFVS
jgi:hypothetical protein